MRRVTEMSRVRAVLLAILCLLFDAVTCERSQSRVVNLDQGTLQGYKDTKYGIYAFYNIPYATVPTGPAKFKAPLPPPVWSDLFEAVNKKIMCPQCNATGFVTESSIIQEECLIANIFVPETTERNLPVVVYVHGGGYNTGWSNLLTPKNLVQSKKVVAVTFNYRLGAHGFLCLGTKDVPGNAGMKDQVALLRWVKKNIAKFGGNSDDVTIAGYSAGASSVDLMMISKLSDNLFKRVIPESGANTAVFTIQYDPIKNAREYAKLISSDKFEDIYALERFYKTVSIEQLNAPNIMNSIDSLLLMSPCVERNVGDEIFLDNSPVNILKSGNFKKVPILYGFSNMDGLLRIPLFNEWKNLMNAKFSDFLPADLKFKNELEKGKIAKRVKEFYFGKKLISEETVLTYVDYFSDILFIYPALRSIKLQIEAGNDQIYLYEYSYVDDDTPVVPYTNIRGATHCAQSIAVLDGCIINEQIEEETNISDDLQKQKEVMREMWLNFIVTGKPVVADSKLPSWLPVGTGWSPYMSLNRTIELKASFTNERSKFWEELYEQYYLYPSPPFPDSDHPEFTN